jgi:hypothetical protein
MPVEAGHSAAPPALRGVNPKRDRRFESRLLHRRVRKLSVPLGDDALLDERGAERHDPERMFDPRPNRPQVIQSADCFVDAQGVI